ncbi:MAG TPA: HupE/UreJ family protein, partial [Burkholderiales bacterium]|nr:HupE/UreJ family protein [Burkholderiales bacterium]
MNNLRAVARAALVLCLLLFAANAHAHSMVKGVGDLYAGLLHVLTALEHVLPFIALSLLAGQRGIKIPVEGVLIVFPVALMLGAATALWVPPLRGLAFFNIASAIVLGGLVAAAWPLPRMVFYGLCIIFGISHGFANGEAISEGTKVYLFILGVGLAGLAV